LWNSANKGDPMEDLRATIQRITEDLNVLMRELSGVDDTRARELVEQLMTSEVLADFKISVDAMRHLLWIYVEAVFRTEGSMSVMQAARLQRAVEMLRSLQAEPAPAHFAAPETFFEHVQNVVDGYGKAPREQTSLPFGS
jgi:hypothetical protein